MAVGGSWARNRASGPSSHLHRGRTSLSTCGAWTPLDAACRRRTHCGVRLPCQAQSHAPPAASRSSVASRPSSSHRPSQAGGESSPWPECPELTEPICVGCLALGARPEETLGDQGLAGSLPRSPPVSNDSAQEQQTAWNVPLQGPGDLSPGQTPGNKPKRRPEEKVGIYRVPFTSS